MLSPTRLPRAFAVLPLRIGALATALALVAGLAVVVAPVAADAGAARSVSPGAMSAVLASATASKPDGRIRLGAQGSPGDVTTYRGPFVGNNVYNTTGAHQTDVEDTWAVQVEGSFVTFDISIQNDGTRADRFKVKATGTTDSYFPVKYFHGTTNITAAVVAGTYRTASLAPGATYLITARVTAGGAVTRLVTITSVANSAKKDAVKFRLRRLTCEC